MQQVVDSDAALLWDDVMELLRERPDLNPAALAMLQSCTPT